MDTPEYKFTVIYWNSKVKDWRKRNFVVEADAIEFYNVRMARALKSMPKSSSGWVSMIPNLTPRLHTL